MQPSPVISKRLLVVVAAGHILVVGGLVAAKFVGSARAPRPTETTLETLAVYTALPRFTLTERSGRPVTRENLAGTVSVVNFIYTHCRETCPTQSLQIARLQSEFGEAPDLRLVSITVDPLHDTPPVLGEYAARYGADPARWLFLTGDKREIYCLAQALNLGVADPSDPNPPASATRVARFAGDLLALLRPPAAFATHGSAGLVMHSARLVLVDRQARVRAYHLATDADSLARLRPNLRALLAESPAGG